MRLSIGALLLLALAGRGAQAQVDQDYKPLQARGPLPEYLLEPAQQNVERHVERIQTSHKAKELEENELTALYRSTALQVHATQLYGYVYVNDPLTAYVRRVGQELLKHVPADEARFFEFHVTRFPAVNAVCFANGHIMVNIGLLARMDNEAQLAAILGHEIAHFLEDHSLRAHEVKVSELKKLKKRDIERGLRGRVPDRENKLIQASLRVHAHSREQELAADSLGFHLLARTSYDPTEMLAALDQMRKGDTRPLMSPEYWIKRLEGKDYRPDTAFFVLDSNWAEKRKPEEAEEMSEEDSLASLMSTHPDMPLRLEAAARMLGRIEAGTQTSAFLQSEAEFDQIKLTARFEMLENYYRLKQYGIVVYECLNLLDDYPANRYLIGRLAASAQGLAELEKHKISSYWYAVEDDYQPESAHYEQFLQFLNDAPKRADEDMQRWVTAYLSRLKEEHPSHEVVAFYHAINQEQSDFGKEAESHYREFIKKFPESGYRAHVEYRLKRIEEEKAKEAKKKAKKAKKKSA